MPLPDYVKVEPGTAIIWGEAGASGVTLTLSLDALADGTARMGAVADLGATWDEEYSVMLVVETGTATTALGTVGSGTADTGWVADTVQAGSIGVATFVAGDVLCVKYDESGTYNPDWVSVGFNVRYGTS